MTRYIIGRIISLLGSILLVSIIVFLMMHSVPGGPFDELKMPLSPAAKANMMKLYGLDKPLYLQYLKYMWSALHFNFGIPYQSPGETIKDLLGRTWPISALLGGIGLSIAFTVGLSLGIISAIKRNSWIDYFTTALATFGLITPTYVVSVALILIFATWLKWAPTGGWGGPKTWIMPAIAYSLAPTGIVARYTRSSMLEVLRQDYIRTARAKGLHNFKVIMKHAFRNALIPLVTIMMPMFTGIMTGSIFVEQIFRVPGLGKFFVSSISERDYPMEMTLVLLVAVLMGITYLLTDLIYCLIDPRIRFD